MNHHHDDHCCAAPPPAPCGLNRPMAGAQQLLLRIENMDCPTEESLIRNRLASMAGIVQLDFNLLQRQLRVAHTLPDAAPIHAALRALDMQATVLADASAPAAAPTRSRRQWWRLGIATGAALLAEILAWTLGDEGSWPVIGLALLALGRERRRYLPQGLDRTEKPQPEHQCADDGRRHRRAGAWPMAGSGDGDGAVHAGGNDRSAFAGARAACDRGFDGAGAAASHACCSRMAPGARSRSIPSRRERWRASRPASGWRWTAC